MSAERVLVTGASGLIGRHVLRPLRAGGYEVHAVSRRGGSDPAVHWHAADLLDSDATRVLLESVRPSRLLHLAWYAEHGRYWTSPENLDWVAASIRLLRGFAEVGGHRAVVAGTCAEYDWGAPGAALAPLAEDLALIGPATLYGTAKDALRRVAAAWADTAGIELAWARVFFLYGPGEHPDRVIASIARHLAAHELAPCSSGEQIRDFLHVADAGAAFAALVASPATGVINLGSGTGVSVADVAQTLGRLAGHPELVGLGAIPARPGDPPRLVADTSRLVEECGWTPNLSLEQGLSQTLGWWQRGGPLVADSVPSR